jgi:hypothetical protein
MVNIVLATAISSSAVKVSLVIRLLSRRTLTKIIMIRALVCNSQPMIEASPGAHLRILPAIRTPMSLPATAATSNAAAATKTVVAPTLQLVRKPAPRKNTGITASKMW